MGVSVVAAVSLDGVLGCNNRIPWSVPADFKHFREFAVGKVLIMGRSTFESIGKPLPDRITVVLTSDVDYVVPDGVFRVGSVSEALELCDRLVSNGLVRDDDVVVAGGGRVYEQFLEFADRVVLSVIPVVVGVGDTFFPVLDESVFGLVSEELRDGFVLKVFVRR